MKYLHECIIKGNLEHLCTDVITNDIACGEEISNWISFKQSFSFIYVKLLDEWLENRLEWSRFRVLRLEVSNLLSSWLNATPVERSDG